MFRASQGAFSLLKAFLHITGQEIRGADPSREEPKPPVSCWRKGCLGFSERGGRNTVVQFRTVEIDRIATFAVALRVLWTEDAPW